MPGVDKQGQRFGRLLVVERDPDRQWHWRCRCDCGTLVSVYGYSLGKNTQSCGCLRRELTRARVTTHGLTPTGRKVPSEFVTWWHAKDRCYDPTNKQFADYGGRGIAMCDRWRNDFGAFYADMGPRPDGTTLDRIDNARGYEPGNCRWATPREQSNNTRRNHWLTIRGERWTVAQAARQFGVSVKTLMTRLCRGWSDEEAVFGRSRKIATR